jgi:predicted nucleotidyltransferase
MIPAVESKLADLTELCRQYRVRRLELFGSAASSRFNPATSDLDFLVEFERSSPAESARFYFGFLFALQTLFGRDVDLVESAAIQNPYFLKAIAKKRVLLYAA